jgi:hypothetical protein
MARANLEPLRSLGFASISASYAAVGSGAAHPTRLICFTNNTEGDMIFSRDATLSAGELFVGKGSFKLFDVQSNLNVNKEDRFVFDQGTQWYVKQSEAPVSGAVYIEMLYGV